MKETNGNLAKDFISAKPGGVTTLRPVLLAETKTKMYTCDSTAYKTSRLYKSSLTDAVLASHS